jgi:THO complex subunit 2
MSWLSFFWRNVVIVFLILTFQVCRVLKAYYLSSKDATRAANVISPESRIEEALGSCLLPSLQLIPANPAVDMEIWGVLSLLPYEVCYTISPFYHSILFYSCFGNLVPCFFFLNRFGAIDVQTRFRLYAEWEKETEQNPIVLAARQTAKVTSYSDQDFSDLSFHLKFRSHTHPYFLISWTPEGS